MPDPPPIYSPPAGQNCVSCIYGITGKYERLECHYWPPDSSEHVGFWAQVLETDWCGKWAAK